MCSLPGMISADAHSLLLDNQIWGEQIRRLAENSGWDFPTNGWDARWGDARKGESFASHVEPKLMLFYACHLVSKLLGEVLPLRKQVGKLYKLKKITPSPQAEMLLTRPPCPSCSKWMAEFEEMTGIHFTWALIPNLGEMLETRKENGYHAYLNPTLPAADPPPPLKSTIVQVVLPKSTIRDQLTITISDDSDSELMGPPPSKKTSRMKKKA